MIKKRSNAHVSFEKFALVLQKIGIFFCDNVRGNGKSSVISAKKSNKEMCGDFRDNLREKRKFFKFRQNGRNLKFSRKW